MNRHGPIGRRIPIRVAYECQIGPTRPPGRLYCDNASTSFPKPPRILDAMADFAINTGTSAGRGSYQESNAAGEILLHGRRNLANLLNAEGPDRIAFTANCSEALNLVVHGMLNGAAPGDEVIITPLEHNSVLRPLEALKQSNGIRVHIMPCDPVTALIAPQDVYRAITNRTRLIVCAHVSNVTGTIQPVAEVCRIARHAGIPCLLDAAQSAGRVELDVQALGCDFMAFPGHKELLGPLGTGGMYFRPGAERFLSTIKEGGTGSRSESLSQPEAMPERFEIGSQNVIGIAGLAAATDWLLDRGVAAIRDHDVRLCKVFMALTAGTNHLTVFGPWDAAQRVGVFSVNVAGMTPRDLAAALEARGILTRAGLHCAPLAHKAIGTYPAGTCRISFGPFQQEDDVRRVARALFELAECGLGGPAVDTQAPPEDLAR